MTLLLTEWWQVRAHNPIWPVAVSRLAARARVGQIEIDGSNNTRPTEPGVVCRAGCRGFSAR